MGQRPSTDRTDLLPYLIFKNRPTGTCTRDLVTKMSSCEKFCLRWNDFETNISVAFRELREDKDFFDVTLACDDQQMQAHKVILSACSPFFRSVLKKNPHAHPLLYLKGVKYVDLVAVLNFMYHGEVNVAQEELNSFLAVAEELKVKGLTQNSPSSPGRRDPVTAAPKRQIVTDPVPPPPPKRPRPPPPIAAPEEEEIQEVASVKAEPREPQYHPQEQEQVDHHQSLAQVDEYGGEEGYTEEDYGQYEEGYAMMASAGAEGNKAGPIDSPEDLYRFLSKLDTGGFSCTLCMKYSACRRDGKNHLEAIHFPDRFSYNCPFCGKEHNSKNTLNVHISRHHKEERNMLNGKNMQ